MQLKIDKELLPMKAHYFLFNAGTAPVVPFMPTLARQLGFSPGIVGTMYTILPIVGMLAKPLFGYIADRYQRHRCLFLAGEIITALAFFMIIFIPSNAQPKAQMELHCHDGVTVLRYQSEQHTCVQERLQKHYNNGTLPCSLRCNMTATLWDIVCNDWLQQNSSACNAAGNGVAKLKLDMNISMQHITNELAQQSLFFRIMGNKAVIDDGGDMPVTLNCPPEKPRFSTNCTFECEDEFVNKQLEQIPVLSNSEALGMLQFWWFFSMLIMSWIGMAVVVSIGDAICFGILAERHYLYGKQRLCGSLGFGVLSIITGILIDQFSVAGQTKNYTIAFWLTLTIMGFDLFASTKLKHTQAHLSTHIFKDVRQIMLSLHSIVFFAWCIVIGLCTALVWNFLFWYLENLNADCQNSMKTLQGIVTGIQCFGGELPFFFLSGWILKKIGHKNAMSLVLFAFGVRFILYSMLQDPWYVLPIELLNGVTFGLFYSTMASYVSIVAPPGTEATMQSLAGAIFEGIGVSMGSLIGGQLFESIGGAHTFELFGCAAFIMFVVHVCVQMCLQRNGDAFYIENGKQQNKNSTQMQCATTQNATSTTIAPPPPPRTIVAANSNDDGFYDVDLRS